MSKHNFVELISGLKKFWSDRTGATSIEYAMIAAGISIVIIVSVNSIGSTVDGNFYEVQDNYRDMPGS